MMWRRNEILRTLPEVNSEAEFSMVVLQCKHPVMVVFYSPWCQNSRALSPQFLRVSREFGDRVQFVRVNADAAIDLKRAYDVRLTPTVILFDFGEPVHRWDNEQEVARYRDILEHMVAPQQIL